MKVKVDFEFFGALVGSEYELIEGTYERNVCDCCGKRRKCDLYKHAYITDYGTGDVVFMDLCRTCAKEHTAEVKE